MFRTIEKFNSDEDLQNEYNNIFSIEKQQMKEKCKITDVEAENVIEFQKNLRFNKNVDNQNVDIAKEPAFANLNKNVNKDCILGIMNEGEKKIDAAQLKRKLNKEEGSGINMITIILILLVAYLLYKKFNKNY